jgi:hypothetical protein
MARLIVGIVAGILAAFATVWIVDLAGHALYPLPSDLNIRDFEAVGAYIQSMPPGALAFVVVAWFAGALLGGLVAALVSERHWTVWLIAGLVAAAGLVNILMIPHPALLQIAAIAAPLLGGFVASQIARSRLARRGGPPA